MTCLKLREDFRGELSLMRDLISSPDWSYLIFEEGDKPIETAGSGGDSREPIGWCAIRKSPVRTRNISNIGAEEEAFTFNFYRRVREGERRDDFGDHRVEAFSFIHLMQIIMQDCSLSYNKQQLRNSGEEGRGVLLSCS